MSRGKKLDLTIGADFEDNWALVEEKSEATTKQETLAPQKHSLYFAKEKRRGKVVTLVGPFYLENKEAKELLKRVKKSLGTGGSFKDNFMEFQGDIPVKIRPLLEKEQFRFKK